MLGSYVCKQCRARLSRHILPIRNPQWQPRASFISLRDNPQDEAEELQSNPPSQDQATVASDEGSGPPRIPIRYTGENTQPRWGAGRYSRHVEHINGQDATPSTRQSTKEQPRAVGLDQGPASAIQRALSNTKNPGRRNKAWQIFEQSYTSRDCKALQEPSLSDAAVLTKGRVFQNLLESVNGAFCKATIKPAVTPTMVLLKFEQLGIAAPEYWTRSTLQYLTHQAIMAVNNSQQDSTRDLPAILLELTSDFHPGHLGNPTLGFCAMYFYTVSDAMETIGPLYQEAKPFLLFLERLLAGSRVDSVLKATYKSPRFGALPEDIQKDIINEIDNAPLRAMTALGTSGETLTEPETGDPAANLEAFHLKRIARAILEKASVRTLNNLWAEVESAFTKNNKCVIPPRIYNAFLSGYIMLLHAPRSVEIWNHMIANGVQPDVQSWVALLEGCEKAKDFNGFNAMWTRMLNSGIEPDNHAWTTRVHGLFSLRKIDLGLAALDDMAKRWSAGEATLADTRQSRPHKGVKSAAPKVNKCVKPSIEVINGAVTALVQLPARAMYHEKRIQFVQKILAWAGNFQIKPDAITYNSLIQLYLRAGDSGTAFRILRQMEHGSISADAATHTMLITFSFENKSFDNITEAQQTEKIISLIDSIEASGLKLNAYIYGAAIDRLLKQYSNYNAVRTIIQHMHDRNMVPSAHVYTSLVTYYFQQDPPAIAAVDSLVDQFFTSHRIVTDRILFDRIIEGYAAHGEVGKMMSVLTRMSKQGVLPGWSALTAVIEALVRDGDFDRARDVARQVEHGVGVAEGGIMGTAQGESRFFAVVRAHGVGMEDAKMGDFMSNGPVGAGGHGSDEQSRQPHTAQDESRTTTQHESLPIQQEVVRAQHDGRRDRDSVQAAIEDEEDVHSFLTDEHEDIHSRVHKP
ncbi:hypothetical protein EK21DRAFT_68821 [Setomelanomma holmii]|uniref:Pentatricopeptide repeat-containing protein n=1 Tax=Setomelanomma holmii TaxID=210430 RepID=A0A9P4H686_9PLEO|nr:hypothetical protein EK21DRAFT_68821 [Setomelanomma holmii]